jgi:hypothetical protein
MRPFSSAAARKLQLAAHDPHGNQRAAADIHRFDVDAVLEKIARVFRHPHGQVRRRGSRAVVDAPRLLGHGITWDQ